MIAQVLLVVVGLIGLVATTVTIARRPEFAVALILVSEFLSAGFILPQIRARIVTLYPGDFVVVALLVAVALRPYLGVARRKAPLALLSLVALASIGFLRGWRVFGLQVAGNDSREIFSFLSAALFFSTVVIDPEFMSRLRRYFTAIGALLVGSALVFWSRQGFGGFATSGQRALTGLAALLLLFATIIAIVVPYGRSRTQNLVVPAIGLATLILTVQRSVAIAGIIALIIIVLVGGRSRTRRSSLVTRFLLVIGGISVGFLVLAGPVGLTEDLGTAVSTSTTQEGTFNWRLEGWRILVGEQLSGSVPSVIIGEPAGSSYLRVIGDSVVTVAPHSEYVSLFRSVGIVGLAIMVWLLISTFRRNVVNVRSTLTFTATTGLLLATLLASLLVYFITYSTSLLGGLVVGLSVSLAWFGARDPEAQVPTAIDDVVAPPPVRPIVDPPVPRSSLPPVDQPVLS